MLHTLYQSSNFAAQSLGGITEYPPGLKVNISLTQTTMKAEEKNGLTPEEEKPTQQPTDDTSAQESSAQEEQVDMEQGDGQEVLQSSDARMKPSPSRSRTTNIPPLMPAGYVPVQERQDETVRKGLVHRVLNAKKKEESAAEEAAIGTLRTESEKPRVPEQAPQRPVRHADEGHGFFRKHWWWMLLVVLVLAFLISLPWTLPRIQEWNADEPPAVTVDTPKVQRKVPEVNPDTIGAAARADSLRQDSIRKAEARRYWLMHRAAQQAQEAENTASEENQTQASHEEAHSNAAHADSVK